jgi:hypothetical protein
MLSFFTEHTLKNLKPMLSMRYIIVSVCSAFAKNTKLRISAPIIKKKKNSASPQVTWPYGSDLCKKICPLLGHAWAPLTVLFNDFWCLLRRLRGTAAARATFSRSWRSPWSVLCAAPGLFSHMYVKSLQKKEKRQKKVRTQTIFEVLWTVLKLFS